ncbi:MAG: DUF1893 domain-containing protein [Oscillospiraceae bacterium]|nr:DUF1893 domain-containing protein [Oscillospiraceae bacterium]
MSDNLTKCREILKSGNFTIVLSDGKTLLTDTKRGVKPLFDLLDKNTDLSGFSAADKVVGKAAAFLYVLLNIKEVYADVISTHALVVFEQHKIPVEYNTLTDKIKNRAGTGFCPMETAVLDENEPEKALKKIREKAKELAQK